MSNETMAYQFAERRHWRHSARIDLDGGRPPTEPWGLFFERRYDYLNGGAEPAFSGKNNLNLLSVIDAAIVSLDQGAFVEIAGCPAYKANFEARS